MARNAEGLITINIAIKNNKTRKNRELDQSIKKILCIYKFIKLQQIFQNTHKIHQKNHI